MFIEHHPIIVLSTVAVLLNGLVIWANLKMGARQEAQIERIRRA
jgi:hypothetical protein